MTVLVPEKERGAKYWFGTGTSNLHADLPGLHSGVAVANARPTFYMRGYRPGTELRLVRETAQTDYRRVKMSGSLDSKVWGQFRPEDVTEVEIESIAQGVVTVKPRTDLKPGEYVVVSSVDRGFRALRMAYEFGVATPANR